MVFMKVLFSADGFGVLALFVKPAHDEGLGFDLITVEY